MNIRHATAADLDILNQIEQECFPPAEAACEESFAERLKYYPEHFWLLEEDGKLISFINGFVTNERTIRDEMFDDPTMHNDKGAWQMIFGVNTILSRRKQGCAGMVLERVVADARASVQDEAYRLFLHHAAVGHVLLAFHVKKEIDSVYLSIH